MSPGPAAYSALNPSKIKKSSPAYSLGGKWNQDFQSPFSPGGMFFVELMIETFVVDQVDNKLVEKPTPGPGHCTSFF